MLNCSVDFCTMSRKLYLCKMHIPFVWVLEIPKSSINLNLWAWGGSRAAEGFPQLGKLSDCEETSLPLSSGHFSLYCKAGVAMCWPWNEQSGSEHSLLPVMADLSAGWEQLKWQFHQNTDLNAQGRETSGKYKPCCSHVCTSRFVLISLCPLASSLPEDLD